VIAAEPPARGAGRRAILEATANVIAEHGLRGLTVERVAQTAGVTPPLVYYHFPDRPALISGALELANDLAPSVTRLGSSDGEDGLTEVVLALCAELDERREVRDLNVIWNEVGALAVFDPTLRDDLRRVTQRWTGAVAAGIRRGVADGSIRAGIDADEAAEILTALVEGLSQQWLARSLDVAEARRALRDAARRILAP